MMRAFLISDNLDSLIGMRLAGVDGVVVKGPNEANLAIEEAIKDHDIGILIFTEKAAEWAYEQVRLLREKGSLPLIVEIPDRHGMKREADFLTSYVREALGVNIE
ncbi:V-type ATP synthase subunit F [Thermovirga lienii]|jgi:V/A-type H+-transporting ATPase subunit F|uniref:V-type ATP synthase subunit F n=1 Tax=Thermovirga lienii TaxID=336261 RepID=UPI00030A0775|nr:V-type ATP synthase subunit F [Thermovirga lienii]